ncbi:MAG: hypothetical protein KC589_11250, partial [Nanoarchaeota archaeon]|nr:hypothetical protein [Nanoarchaeota archaeon]
MKFQVKIIISILLIIFLSKTAFSNYTTQINSNFTINETNITINAQYIKIGGYNIPGISNSIGLTIWEQGDFDSSDGSYGVAIFDCENKGEKDCIAVGTNQADKGLIAFYRNGTLVNHSDWPGNETTSGIVEIEAGDLDGDGFENDLALADGGADRLRIFNSSGAQIFSVSPQGASGARLLGSLEIGNFDNIGTKDDIAFSIVNTDTVYAYNKTGTNTWSQMWSYNPDYYTTGEVHVQDFNSDGLDDVATGAIYSMLFYGNNGSLVYSAPTSNAYSVHLAEIRSDLPFMEMIVGYYGGSGGGRTPSIYMYNSTKVWGTPITSTHGAELSYTNMSGKNAVIQSADGSYSGKDVYYINGTNGAIKWQGGLVGATTHQIIDFDNDSSEDIVIGRSDGRLRVYNATGFVKLDYNISKGSIGSNNAKYNGIKGLDVNNDSIDDIVVLSAQGYLHIFQEVQCFIAFNDSTSYPMIWNYSVKTWTYKKNYPDPYSLTYNISCNKKGYSTANLINESISITSSINNANARFPFGFINIIST